jgi:hypothetical protein
MFAANRLAIVTAESVMRRLPIFDACGGKNSTMKVVKSTAIRAM